MVGLKITLFYEDKKYILENSENLLRRATETLNILEKQREIFKSVVYSGTEEQNDKIIENKIKDWIGEHRVIKADGTINLRALYNEKNRFLSFSKTL